MSPRRQDRRHQGKAGEGERQAVNGTILDGAVRSMPVHDWTRVSDATFHDFHYSWVLEIKRALQRGLLPNGYYVMAEQFGGDLGAPDVLTLQAVGSKPEPEGSLAGTATLTESPPAVHTRTTITRDSYARVQRTL